MVLFLLMRKNGNDNNDGSFSNPYRTINGWYKGNKSDSTHRDDFVYYMDGTYRTRDAPIEDGIRMACVSGNKPMVHMAYPGETPVIDVLNSHWIYYQGSSHVYFQGLVWDNIDQPNPSRMKQNAIVIESTGDHVTLFRNTFEGGIYRNLEGRNAAMIFSTNGREGRNWAIVNNRFNNVLGYSAVLAYDLENGLIAENVIENMSGGSAWGLYIKISNKELTLRQNSSIGSVSKPLIRLDGYTTEERQRDIEVCYNNGTSSERVLYIGNNPSGAGRIWSYRNTWRGGFVMIRDQGGDDGPFHFEKDTIVHNGSYRHGFHYKKSATAPVLKSKLLVGNRSLTNEQGRLVGQNRREYLGKRGHEIHP